MKIVTQHVYPPIGTRVCDWSAATENYELGAPLEYGPTEKAAVEALMENHCLARGADPDSDDECRLCFAKEGGACKAVLP